MRVGMNGATSGGSDEIRKEGKQRGNGVQEEKSKANKLTLASSGCGALQITELIMKKCFMN